MKRIFLRFLLAACTMGAALPAYSIEVAGVTCEMLTDPAGISAPHPRLGWRLASGKQGDRQTAYRIVVSRSGERAAQGIGDWWDSGRTFSSQSQLVPYEGRPLEAGKRYYWSVRVWDAEGKPSAWSEPGVWEQAPASEKLTASWIGAIRRADARLPKGRVFHAPSMKDTTTARLWGAVDPLAKRSILLRKPFVPKKAVKEAVIYVSGLGHYELTLDGEKIGDNAFAPLWSDYDKTVYYNTYRVEDRLKPDEEQVLGVWLGNGMYNVTGDRYRKFWVSFGPPTLFFQAEITYVDGTKERLVSDESWKWSESPVTFDCMFGGEDYDARLEQAGWDRPGFDDSGWKRAVVQGAPKGKLTPQTAPPVKVMETYGVKSVSRPKADVLVFDMGQNLSGFPTLKVRGKAGQKVRLTVGESLKKDGTVNQSRTGKDHYYEYTLKGEGTETWTPRFSYYGYQYIQAENVDYERVVSGDGRPVILELTSNFVYSSASPAGTFECSNEMFNRVHWLIDNAIRSNMQAVFTDCPHREKLGWLEQVHLNGPGLYYNYDLTGLMPKVMQDMADAQHPDGLVPSITPEYTDFGVYDWGKDFQDSPEWGSAVAIVPWMFYEYYGDSSLIVRYYPAMARYVDYLGTKADGYILNHGLGDWYDYGEHVAGYSKNSPIGVSATSHWYFAAAMTEKAARMTGDAAGAEKYGRLAERIRKAFNAKYFDPETKQYGTGSQFCNAVAVFLNLVEPQYRQAVLDNLIAGIEAHGTRLTTGDVGNRYLYRVLADNGYNDVMYRMQNHYDAPGYGFQVKYGLTTLTEQWDPRKGNSWNHFMMGQIEEWFYRTLAGIRPDPKEPGFRKIVFAPQPTGDLTRVEASHRTLYGDVKASWNRKGDKFVYDIEVPVNCTGEVILPGRKGIKVNGRKVVSDGTVQVGSGSYRIECLL